MHHGIAKGISIGFISLGVRGVKFGESDIYITVPTLVYDPGGKHPQLTGKEIATAFQDICRPKAVHFKVRTGEIMTYEDGEQLAQSMFSLL